MIRGRYVCPLWPVHFGFFDYGSYHGKNGVNRLERSDPGSSFGQAKMSQIKKPLPF